MPVKCLKMSKKNFPSEYGNAIAMEYLRYLVSDEYVPEETARFFLNMSFINHKPLHFFMAEALVDYQIYLSQDPDEDQEESIH